MFKKPHYLALGLVGLLTLLVLNLPNHAAGRLKLAVGSFFLPLFGLSKSAQQVTNKAAGALVPRSELVQENEALRKENQQLRAQALQAEAVLHENDQLRQILKLAQQSRWRFQTATVVETDPANWWHSIKIDLGSRDGIKVDRPVLSMDGYFVGRVSAVGFTTSTVALIGDAGCRVSAEVEKANVDGIIFQTSGKQMSRSLVDLSYLPPKAPAKAGELVYTSGMGQVIPRGLLIGQIVDADWDDTGQYYQARVKLSSNVDSLEEVLVLTQ
jgi:rod shape-determining protein MreC